MIALPALAVGVAFLSGAGFVTCLVVAAVGIGWLRGEPAPTLLPGTHHLLPDGTTVLLLSVEWRRVLYSAGSCRYFAPRRAFVAATTPVIATPRPSAAAKPGTLQLVGGNHGGTLEVAEMLPDGTWQPVDNHAALRALIAADGGAQ